LIKVLSPRARVVGVVDKGPHSPSARVVGVVDKGPHSPSARVVAVVDKGHHSPSARVVGVVDKGPHSPAAQMAEQLARRAAIDRRCNEVIVTSSACILCLHCFDIVGWT